MYLLKTKVLMFKYIIMKRTRKDLHEIHLYNKAIIMVQFKLIYSVINTFITYLQFLLKFLTCLRY